MQNRIEIRIDYVI